MGILCSNGLMSNRSHGPVVTASREGVQVGAGHPARRRIGRIVSTEFSLKNDNIASNLLRRHSGMRDAAGPRACLGMRRQGAHKMSPVLFAFRRMTA